MTTFYGFVVAITLQLSAPKSTKIHVIITIIILKHTRINGITSVDGMIFRNKRTFRFITHGYANVKNVIFVFQRKIKIIFSVFESHIRIPKLTTSPRNVFYIENDSVIFNFTLNGIH
jgi:hypothetical protein